jgi:hypothetical protein
VIRNDDDDHRPGQRGQEWLKHKKYEIRQDRDNPVEQHRAQTPLRTHLAGQMFSPSILYQQTDSAYRRVCQPRFDAANGSGKML